MVIDLGLHDDFEENETVVIEPDLYIAECQLGETIEPTTEKYEDLIVVEGEPCTSQVGASDVPEVGDSTCAQILEESTESHKNVHGDLGEGACIGKNKVNADEVAFVGNKAIENTSNIEKIQHLLLVELIDEVSNTNATVVNENECGLSCDYEEEQTGWKNFKCIRVKLSTQDGEKLVVKEVDNKKKKRKGKDKSDHIITEKITMRKCEKRSIHPILPEDFVEAPCMMLGKKKVN